MIGELLVHPHPRPSQGVPVLLVAGIGYVYPDLVQDLGGKMLLPLVLNEGRGEGNYKALYFLKVLSDRFHNVL